jgi:hypothetical protein
MISPLLLLRYSEDEEHEKEEEEAVPDIKVHSKRGGYLPLEFWQVTASWTPPSPSTPRTMMRRRRRPYLT